MISDKYIYIYIYAPFVILAEISFLILKNEAEKSQSYKSKLPSRYTFPLNRYTNLLY